MDDRNTANVLGALALRLTDELARAALGGDRDPGATAALVQLSKYPGASIAGLRVPLALSHSGCVRLVDRLVAAGQVERRAARDDARAVALHLTRKGRTVVAAAQARREEVLTRALAALSAPEKGKLAALMGKLLAGEIGSAAAALRTCRLCDYTACRECPVATAVGAQ